MKNKQNMWFLDRVVLIGYLKSIWGLFWPLLLYFSILFLLYGIYELINYDGSTNQGTEILYMFSLTILEIFIYPISIFIFIIIILYNTYKKFKGTIRENIFCFLFSVFYFLFFIFYFLFSVFYFLFSVFLYELLNKYLGIGNQLPLEIYSLFQYFFILLSIIIFIKDKKFITRYGCLFIAAVTDTFLKYMTSNSIGDMFITANEQYYQFNLYLIPLSFAICQLVLEAYHFYKKEKKKNKQ